MLQQRIEEGLERLLGSGEPTDQVNWGIPDWLQKVVFWAIVLGIAGWAVWQFVVLVSPYLNPYLRRSSRNRRDSFLKIPTQSVAEWLQQAHLARRQHDYREACCALYQATLYHLHHHHQIQNTPSRTDGEYLSLVRAVVSDLPLVQPYCLLIETHEYLRFSDALASEETYDRCWRAYQAIERSAQQGGASG